MIEKHGVRCFELSRKLAEETNIYKGITLLFNNPVDNTKPKKDGDFIILRMVNH
ncbi:hypothetical protein AtEden1_Chr2g0243811 [Arabidopsis thaliana]